MINNVNLSLFPSNELFTFSESALAIVEEKKVLIPAIAPFWEKARHSVVLFQTALEHETKNPFTVLLAEKDMVRDNAFLAFRFYVQATAHRATAGWGPAAEKILQVIHRHGWTAYSMGYKAETAAIAPMVYELKNNFSAGLSLIGATEWLEELETAETDFDAMVKQSMIDFPAEEPSIRRLRPLHTASMKNLFAMVSLQQAIAPSDDLTALETSLNELILRSLTTVKAARTRDENLKNGNGNGNGKENGNAKENGNGGEDPAL